MPIEWVSGGDGSWRYRLSFNDVLIYRQARIAGVNADAPAQPASLGPYVGKIVDFEDLSFGVRADGFWGLAPLYYVRFSDVLGIERGA